MVKNFGLFWPGFHGRRPERAVFFKQTHHILHCCMDGNIQAFYNSSYQTRVVSCYSIDSLDQPAHRGHIDYRLWQPLWPTSEKCSLQNWWWLVVFLCHFLQPLWSVSHQQILTLCTPKGTYVIFFTYYFSSQAFLQRYRLMMIWILSRLSQKTIGKTTPFLLENPFTLCDAIRGDSVASLCNVKTSTSKL